MRTVIHIIKGRSGTCARGITTPVYDPKSGEVEAPAGAAMRLSSRRLSWSPGRQRNPSGLRLTPSIVLGRYSQYKAVVLRGGADQSSRISFHPTFQCGHNLSPLTKNQA
jgi:hypothetical protein